MILAFNIPALCGGSDAKYFCFNTCLFQSIHIFAASQRGDATCDSYINEDILELYKGCTLCGLLSFLLLTIFCRKHLTPLFVSLSEFKQCSKINTFSVSGLSRPVPDIAGRPAERRAVLLHQFYHFLNTQLCC